MKLLNDSQFDRLSEISGNLGLVFFASMVVPFLTRGEKIDTLLTAVGLMLSVAFWAISILLLKKVKL